MPSNSNDDGRTSTASTAAREHLGYSRSRFGLSTDIARTFWVRIKLSLCFSALNNFRCLNEGLYLLYR